MSALTTHTTGNQRKGKRKETTKRKTPTSDPKPKKGKEQDHLKKTSLGHLRQGQRLNTSDTKHAQAKSTTTKEYKSSPCTYANSP
jgi:hypothetical protein